MNLKLLQAGYKLKGDFEGFVLVVGGGVLDFGFGYIVGEGFLYVPDAASDVVGISLGEHFDGSIRQISDKAGQFVSVGYVKRGKTKADTLYAARKNYMFSCLYHF